MDQNNTNFENQKSEENTTPMPSTESVWKNETVENTPIISQTAATKTPTVTSETQNENTEPVIPSPAVKYRWDYHEQLNVDHKYASKKRNNGTLLYAGIFGCVFLITICLLIGSLFLHGVSSPEDNPTHNSISELYEECLPSYVAISVKNILGEGVGSGIVITSDGYIATNYHVVEGALTINVITSDGNVYDAEFIDGDELNDIAVVKIDAQNLTVAKLGSSENSRVGDQVMAIGTPHSIDYQGTMTSGYISALNRRFVEENTNGTIKKVLYLIQTDTSVNPGNSGGPLFNMSGEVIGIVTLKIAGNNYEGLGFALPIESVINMINDIIENGEITDPNAGGATQGAALGISGFAVTKDTKYALSENKHFEIRKDAETGEEKLIYPTAYGDVEIPLSDKAFLAQYGIAEYSTFVAQASGILVFSTTDVFDSADKLQVDDIIISADGISCEKMSSLKSLIADKKVGDKIDFEIFRDGKIISITIELGKSSETEN